MGSFVEAGGSHLLECPQLDTCERFWKKITPTCSLLLNFFISEHNHFNRSNYVTIWLELGVRCFMALP